MREASELARKREVSKAHPVAFRPCADFLQRLPLNRLRRIGRSTGVKRDLGKFLHDYPALVARSSGNPARDAGCEAQALCAREFLHQAFGIVLIEIVGDVGERFGIALGQLYERGGLPERAGDRDYRALDARGIEKGFHRGCDLVACRLDPQRPLPTEQADRGRLVRKQRGIRFCRLGGNGALFRLQRLQQPLAVAARLPFVLPIEKVEADCRVRPVERSAEGALRRPHLEPVRVAYSASRATIWSATASASHSAALCSAATVAYSELTTSTPASDPAVASSTTCPLLAETSR